MDEDTLQKARYRELSRTAFLQNRYTFTRFLRPEELSLLDEPGVELQTAVTIFGGYACSERQMVRFGSPELLGYEEAFPIVLFAVRPKSPRFAERLEHRDYLGALMHLGIERDMIGDILVKEGEAYIFCAAEIFTYIESSLDKIRHTDVVTERQEELPEALKPQLVPIELLTASERFDAVVAAAGGLSRAKAQALFSAKKVLLNGRVCENTSLILKEGQSFSAAGCGKYIYRGVSGASRKGKLYVRLMRYQ